MEPKVIKEETIEKEVTSYVDTQGPLRTRNKTVLNKDRCKTPDSPEGAHLSPTQSSPHSQHLNGLPSPLHNNSPPLTPPPALDHPGAVSGHPQVQPQQPPGLQSQASLSTPLASSPYGTYAHGRPSAKVKRFLGTLVQFGNDISQDVGDRVRSLVLSLVSSSLSVEEFHHSLQDVTNFPLRPFVLPFLRAHLPPLQREVHALARAAKQTPLQYLRAHDHVVLEAMHSPSEPSEIFLSTSAVADTLPAAPASAQAPVTLAPALKRRASDALYENGLLNGTTPLPLPAGSLQDVVQDYNTPPPAKRPYNLLLQHSLLGHVPHAHFFDYSQHGHVYTANTSSGHRPDETVDSSTRTSSSSRGDEEWRNIHVMLNCILSMVEKTKRALSILQQRNSQDLTSEWLRKQDVSADLKKAAGEIMAQAVRQTEDRVAEVKRKAEEAVNDVKRQAVVELQKAVAAAEIKANELVASERAKMEKMLLGEKTDLFSNIEARKHSEETSSSNHVDSGENSQSPPVSTQPAPSQQNSCWNCGRKAHETCSGCSTARYCGPFCQHKDWENHHQLCNSRDKSRPARAATPGAGVTSATTAAPLTSLSNNAPSANHDRMKK